MSAFLDENGKLVTVSSSNPLPVGGLVTVSSSNPLPVAVSQFKNQHHSHDLLTQLLMRLMMRLQTARQNQHCLVLLTVQMQTVGGQGYIVKTRLLTNQNVYGTF